MYLTDNGLRQRLADLSIYTTNSKVNFDPDTQIQPCSIDLRLSPIYWRPSPPAFWRPFLGRSRVIDLTGSRLMEVSPRRHWSSYELAPGETLTLRPGEMVLARTYESFAIPADCAGAIHGRSSFARMGLSVHSTGDFINPGWAGHMPLSLVNSGRAILKLPAFLPICQLVVIQLGVTPNRVYGERTLASKYINDDGGPSYWWRDKMVRRLLDRMGKNDLGLDVQERLLERIGVPPDEVLERLERLVGSMPYRALSNADELLAVFTKREDRQRMRDKMVRFAVPGIFLALVSTSLAALFDHPYAGLHYGVWAVTVLSAAPTLLTVVWSPGKYFGRQDLKALDVQRSKGVAAGS